MPPFTKKPMSTSKIADLAPVPPMPMQAKKAAQYKMPAPKAPAKPRSMPVEPDADDGSALSTAIRKGRK